MEPDRFQHSPKVYIIGMVCMLISMALFGLGAYILPRLVFDLAYNIPDFIFSWTNWIHIAYDLNEKKAGWLLVTIIFLLGFGASIITYAVSNHIESKIYGIEPEKVNESSLTQTWKESGPLVLKIVFILGFIFIIAKIFQWTISIG